MFFLKEWSCCLDLVSVYWRIGWIELCKLFYFINFLINFWVEDFYYSIYEIVEISLLKIILLIYLKLLLIFWN